MESYLRLHPNSSMHGEVKTLNVPQSTLKRTVLSFHVGGECVTAMGQSKKSKTSVALCMMHAVQLIDHHSVPAADAKKPPPPLPLQDSMMESDVRLAQVTALAKGEIQRTGNAVVDEAAERVSRARGKQLQCAEEALALQSLNGKISDGAEAMHVTKVARGICVATLPLNASTGLIATGVGVSSKEAKRSCAFHALKILEVVEEKSNAASGLTGHSAPMDAVLQSIAPHKAKLYHLYQRLFSTEEPVTTFARSEGGSGDFVCRLQLSDVSCEGRGINRFEAERQAMNAVMDELEKYDPRVVAIGNFLRKYPDTDIAAIPTARLPEDLKEKVRQEVEAILQRLPHLKSLTESPDGRDPRDASGMPITEEILARRFSGERHPNSLYAERLREQLSVVRSSPEYLEQYHPRRSTLAMHTAREQLLEAVAANGVTIVCGTTGSGKTTQVPQYLLDEEIMAGRGDLCNIIVTQPRRLTACSVSERIASERLGVVGKEIGYAVRLDAKPGSHVTLCTTGVLLQIFAKNPTLTGVTYLLIDEVHERDINCDVVLALAKQARQSNPLIKIILMSATMEVSMFTRYFGNAPVIQVEGAAYPVALHYLEDIAADAASPKESSGQRRSFYSPMFDLIDLQKKNALRGGRRSGAGRLLPPPRARGDGLYQPAKTDYHLIAYLVFRSVAVHMHHSIHGKSVLVFLPGWKELLAAKSALENYVDDGADRPVPLHIILLHSTVDAAKQRACFQPAPPGYLKVVLATNIAESGITIDDAVVVIDTGLIKTTAWVSSAAGHGASPGDHPSESAPSFTTQLSLRYASQANGTQRKGRTGRTQGGVCYRLFTRLTWDALPPFQEAEIHRVPLNQVLLKLLSLGHGAPKATLQTFLEPPSTANVEASMAQLKHLDAVTAQETLTPLGHYLAQLPCDPRIGKLVMMGAVLHCLDSVLTIAATADLSPYVTSREVASEVRERRHLLARGSQSDQISDLNAYNAYCVTKGDDGFVRFNYLHRGNISIISKYKQQYRDILHRSGLISSAELCPRAAELSGNGDGYREGVCGGADDEDAAVCVSVNSAHEIPDGPFVDATMLSKDALDVALVKACLCAALFPNVGVLDPSALLAQKMRRKLTLRTQSYPSITPGSESACRGLLRPQESNAKHPLPTRAEYFQAVDALAQDHHPSSADRITVPAMFYVFQDVFCVRETNKRFLTSVSSISLWALLLFGAAEAKVEYFEVLGLCVIDGWVTVRLDPETFRILHSLRRTLHACVWSKYRDPLNVVNNEALRTVCALSRSVLKAPLAQSDTKLQRLVDSGVIINPSATPSRMREQQQIFFEGGRDVDSEDDCIIA